MELTVLHLYPDCMNLYGEWANVAVLKRHLEAMGVTVTVKEVTLDETPDFASAGFVYMGAGTERTQKAVLMALKDKGGELKQALEDKTVALFTGNAMEVPGQAVTDAHGQRWAGMAIAPYSTVETNLRDPGDVIARSSLLEKPVVGFMNKCSVTAGVETPLFEKLALGLGNQAQRGAEGYVSGSLYATHITGPILAKNPHVTAFFIRKIFEKQGWDLPDTLPVLPYEAEAYDVTLAELSARVKED